MRRKRNEENTGWLSMFVINCLGGDLDELV